MWKKHLRTRPVCRRNWCGVRDWFNLSADINVHCPWWYFEDDYLSWAYRSLLGIGWRRGSQRCHVPEALSSYTHRKPRKADRGINKALSKTILKRTGIFIPVGSGKFTVWLLYDKGKSICWNFKAALPTERRAVL